jgi:hypothetical protein
MRRELFVAIAAVLTAACAQTGDADVEHELRLESATSGLALVSAIAGHVIVVPFDGPVKYLESEYRFPISALGRGGRMVLWWSPRSFFDSSGTLVIDFTNGKRVAEAEPPVIGFHPLALSETARRIAFWGRPRGKNMISGLHWASFDFSRTGLVDQATGYPDWSPDGGSLVYDKEGKIYAFEIARGSSRPLTDGRLPTWSPDGKLIAFLAPSGRASLITTEGVPIGWPIARHEPISAIRWSPNGLYVSFSERLPSRLALRDAVSRLVVCRVSDGKTISVQEFSSKGNDYEAYHWIVDYSRFCSRCASKSTTRNE